MARLTRNSYKRKIILFAVFVFISIALISTGFAAWVMSNDATVDANGNVSVGVVADSSLGIEFNKTEFEAFTYQFEPAEGDNTGRVRLEKATTENPNPAHEQLSFTIKGKITNPDILAKLTVEIELPAGIQAAITEGFIVAPNCANGAVEVTVDKVTGEFEYEIAFQWGTKFGNTNPSLYYDNIEAGIAVKDADVKTTLEDLRAYVYEYYDAMTADGADRATVISNNASKPMPTFKVTIVAEAN